MLANTGRHRRGRDIFGEERLSFRIRDAIHFFFPQSGSYRVQLALFLCFSKNGHPKSEPGSQECDRERQHQTNQDPRDGAQVRGQPSTQGPTPGVAEHAQEDRASQRVGHDQAPGHSQRQDGRPQEHDGP